MNTNTASAQNPFAARLAQAAQEGYLTGSRRARINTAAARPASGQPSATPAQISYAKDLLESRCVIAEDRPKWYARLLELQTDPAQVDQLTREQCSALITALKALPVYEARTADAEIEQPVPEGRYAIEWNETLWFVKLDRPTEGRWAGRVFIERQLGGEFVPVSRSIQARLFRLIMADPKAAMIRYGHELGHCGRCGRELTNEESRAAGIGPVCADKDW